MKKSKFLIAAAAVATAITCAFGAAACNPEGTTDNGDDKITAVYQLYAESAAANGESVLTYEQWLASIKGPQGPAGATGATGKSAYEVAVANGFEGTEAEWLASLKGANGNDGATGATGAAGAAGAAGATGATGATGKSAYEIAKDNGFEGTEAEWLASLKGANGAAGADGAQGEKGEDGAAGAAGAQGVGVVGIYETSEGRYVKFTDGSVQPIQNGGAENPLLTVGENNVTLPVAVKGDNNKTNASGTLFDFYSFKGGQYEIRISSNDLELKWTYWATSGTPPTVSSSSYDPYKKSPAGQWEDGTEYWAATMWITPEFLHTITVKNWSETNTDYKIEIVRLENQSLDCCDNYVTVAGNSHTEINFEATGGLADTAYIIFRITLYSENLGAEIKIDDENSEYIGVPYGEEMVKEITLAKGGTIKVDFYNTASKEFTYTVRIVRQEFIAT